MNSYSAPLGCPRYEIVTCYGAPQCGYDVISFEDLEALEYYIDSVQGVADDIREGYARINEIA